VNERKPAAVNSTIPSGEGDASSGVFRTAPRCVVRDVASSERALRAARSLSDQLDGAPTNEPCATLLAPHVLLLEFGSWLDGPAAKALSLALGRYLMTSAQPVHTFWDLRFLIGYHSDARVAMTSALLTHRAKVASAETLARSKIVTMGLAVANITLGGVFRPHATRKGFELLLARRLGKPFELSRRG
jgi:hypothetical protein